MAVRSYTEETQVGGSPMPAGVKIIKWTGLEGGDTGTPYKASNFPDKSVHITGTFNGQTLTMQGTNDPAEAEFLSLTDPQGNAIAKTAAALEQILENTYSVRPSVSAGAGVSLTVYLLLSTQARR